MSLRITALLAGAVLVLASLVYLSIEVRARPTPEPARPRELAPRDDAPPRTDPSDGDTVADEPRVGAATRRAGRALGLDGAARGIPGALGSRIDRGEGDGVLRDTIPAADRPDPAGDVTGSRVAEASKLYDAHDYEGAMSLARTLLETDATNARLIRIVVSSGCASGDLDTAKAYYARLVGKDRRDMQKRCGRMGLTIDDAVAAPTSR